jgi:hypothetical protein
LLESEQFGSAISPRKAEDQDKRLCFFFSDFQVPGPKSVYLECFISTAVVEQAAECPHHRGAKCRLSPLRFRKRISAISRSPKPARE